MNDHFFLSSVQYLLDAESDRVFRNCGVSADDWKLLVGSRVWTRDERTRVRRVLDSVVYGVMDMSGMARVDVPAEVVASVIAATVSPLNWMPVSAWLEGLKPARDLAEAEETVEIERVSAGRMLALIHYAHAALSGGDAWEEQRSLVQRKLAKVA